MRAGRVIVAVAVLAVALAVIVAMPFCRGDQMSAAEMRQKIAALEEELAELLGTEAALVFSTGYMANAGVIPTLAGPGDVIVSDDSLARAISDIRTALGDDPSHARYIRTVHRQGYVFVAKVRSIDDLEPEAVVVARAHVAVVGNRVDVRVEAVVGAPAGDGGEGESGDGGDGADGVHVVSGVVR